MSFNPTRAVEVPLEVFSGLCTEMSPSDLPEGISPDCQDVVFVPGSVSSRPGLRKVFGAPFFPPRAGAPVPTTTYGKSYVDPTGKITNLYLDSNGSLWKEDPIGLPGVYGGLAVFAPNSYAKSITAFGREYLAISDGKHGTEIPLQYDGSNLDRVTQDGPGASPSAFSISLGSRQMAISAPPPVLSVNECDPANAIGPGGAYTAINVFINGPATDASAGQQVTIAGNSQALCNGTWTVTAVYSQNVGLSLIVVSASLPSGTTHGLGGTCTIGSGTTIRRANNIVSVSTNGDHNLQVGYRVQINSVPASQVGAGIANIVINNEDQPGLATVLTNSAHGLVPGLFVSIQGVTPSIVIGISSAIRAGGVSTIVTASPHGLSPGASVTIGGVTDASFNTTAFVAQVVSDTEFTYLQNSADATSSGGTMSLNWPIPNTATPSYYEVKSAPTANSFQVEINYTDGTWGGGTVSYAWDGIFFVSAVTSSTSFQYQQYGPDADSTQIGRVTPYGQASPGIHQMQVMFLTRQGYITKPSPPVSFVANGGQYISVSNIPIGPPNVIARVLAFTGADGAYFFYIPTAAQVNGQIVSTATQINDNTTTSVLLDFSDNTLYASIGIDVPGNNIANQIKLDGALGFGFYADRLITYGQRNTIQNLLNMGFDGGYLPSAPTLPTGWTPFQPGGSLVPGHFGDGWQIVITPGGSPCGTLFQNAASDAYGAPILQPNTAYRFRCWIKSNVAMSDISFLAILSSASTGFYSAASIVGAAITVDGGWAEADFQIKTPATIPDDIALTITASSSVSAATIVVDDLSVIYADNPYLDTILYGSYVNNPEAFDGVSGKFGPSTDTHKVMDFGIIRDTFYMLTEDPSGRLHETVNNGITEPAGWQINEIGSNCGMVSAFCLTKSQADDTSASGGEEWLAWGSSSGARIFGGDQPWKISQEIQPDWDSINFAASATIWALNNPTERRMYFGVPYAGHTAPSQILVMDYRELDTANQIAASAPIHTSLSGKLIATDHVRKWTRWNLPMNGGALMYREVGRLSTTLFCGNGQYPGTDAGFGNAYTLDPAKLTDDDYGQIYPYYITYFFVNHEAEMALQLGAHRKMLSYLMAQVSGVGNITITPLVNTITNPWRLVCVRALSLDPKFDLEWAGANVTGQRMAFKVESSPITETDNSFSLTKLVAAMVPNKHLPVRGAAK